MITLPLQYASFALIATAINLLAQYLWLSIDRSRFALFFALLFGTLTGLIVKYLLDKKYIFRYITTSVTHSLKKFTLYSIMGIFTTAIFWTSELTFQAIWMSPVAKYFGGAIGLGIGYTVKYFLDKKFVFVK